MSVNVCHWLLAMAFEPTAGLSLYWPGQEFQFGAVSAAPACSGTLTVPAPEVCPSDLLEETTAQNVVASSTVAQDSAGEPWVFVLFESLTLGCGWSITGGCIETQPCYCAQQLSSSVNGARLLMRSVLHPDRQAWLALTGIERKQQALRVRSNGDGSFSIVISDTEYDTELRWLTVRPH